MPLQIDNVVAPETAPSWAQDRAALWSAAEESETRRNAVTAREWVFLLPSEISAEDRSQITREFAEQLVSRYGVAVDVAKVKREPANCSGSYSVCTNARHA